MSAVLSDSVPPLVKITSSGLAAPIPAATCSRASSSPRYASRPSEYSEFALPNRSEKYGSIASRTRSSTGVVAA